MCALLRSSFGRSHRYYSSRPKRQGKAQSGALPPIVQYLPRHPRSRTLFKSHRPDHKYSPSLNQSTDRHPGEVFESKQVISPVRTDVLSAAQKGFQKQSQMYSNHRHQRLTHPSTHELSIIFRIQANDQVPRRMLSHGQLMRRTCGKSHRESVALFEQELHRKAEKGTCS